MNIPALRASQKSTPSSASINEAMAHARQLSPTIDSAHRAAQQKLSLAELERLYSKHSAEFSLSPQRLKAVVIDGLAAYWSAPIEKFLRAKFDPPSPPGLSSYISVFTGWLKAAGRLVSHHEQTDHGAELQQHHQKVALIFEHLGDFNRALTIRTDIAKFPYSEENAFAIARLLEKQLPYETFKIFLSNCFKERHSDFLLATARRNVFAERDAANSKEIVSLLENIRNSAEQEPEDIKLQLALGLGELAAGNTIAASRQFAMTWVLKEQQRRATIDHGQTIPRYLQLDPWSLAYAFAYISEGLQSRSHGIFRPIDPVRLNMAAAKMLRAENAGLAALTYYGALMNANSASRPPQTNIGYRNYWIIYYRDRWVAVPRSFVLSWILPTSLGVDVQATMRKPSRWKHISKVKLWIGNTLASLIRFCLKLPGAKMAIWVFARFRNFAFLKFGSRFGVISASELSILKQKIDVLSR